MNRILTKRESDALITKLDLNRMLEGVFTDNEYPQLMQFMIDHQYRYYNMRDKLNSGGQFRYKLSALDVLTYAKEYKLYSVYQSLAEADDNLLSQGEVCINRKTLDVDVTLDTRKGISCRKAMERPEYIVSFNLLLQKEPQDMQGLGDVIDMIFKHDLFDIVVEYSFYSVPVGIHHSPLIIWELRNY
jgi:hypothetical protein